MIERHQWKRVQVNQKSINHPTSRWGHTSCTVNNQIYFFGGYADSHYMNDLWSYNINTLEWKQIKTQGNIPSHRSNCTMHYDQKNDRIIIFGGGGQNKKRFNSIHILDLRTKEWLQISPKQNEEAPWQRTYHIAELLYPYLIVFGGQGIADLNDLWIFNFLTLQWKQMKNVNSKPFPCPRRFHSSALIGNKFYVIAGCHGKYKPLSDIYSLDLTNLINSGKIDDLEWKEHSFKNSSYLSRWGQSSTVFENKIYVFGGRFSTDLNDILVIDCESEIIKPLKTGHELPKPRRRHSASFFGSCLVIFGGFNGDYFNDLFYINIMDLKSKFQSRRKQENNQLQKLVGNYQFSNHQIFTNEGQPFPIHKGLICQRFIDQKTMEEFLSEIDSTYTKQKLKQLFYILYSGKGQKSSFKQIFTRYLIKVDSSDDNFGVLRNATNGSKNSKTIKNQIMVKSDQQFMEFLEECRNPSFTDFSIRINSFYHVPINSIKLIIDVPFFKNLLKYHQPNNKTIDIQLPIENPIMFEILINFINTDQVVIPGDMTEQTWMDLCTLANYFCMDNLVKICEKKLVALCCKKNVKQIFTFSLKEDLVYLNKSCCESVIREYSTTILNQQQILKNQLMINIPQRYHSIARKNLNQMIGTILFDLKQIAAKNNCLNQLKKKDSGSTQGGQKENYQYNYID